VSVLSHALVGNLSMVQLFFWCDGRKWIYVIKKMIQFFSCNFDKISVSDFFNLNFLLNKFKISNF
jgi:hypothetical protein